MNKAAENSILSFKDELHARPYIKLGNNLRTFHFAYLIKDNDEKNAWNYLSKYLKKLNFQSLPKEPSKYWVAEGKDLIIRYECHTEFISLTLIYPDKIEGNNKNIPIIVSNPSVIQHIGFTGLNSFGKKRYDYAWHTQQNDLAKINSLNKHMLPVNF